LLNPCFQVNLDVAGRDCLVIGGNAEAADKTRRLMDARARVRLVSPTITDPLRCWRDAGRLHHEERTFAAADLDGVFLVVNAVSSDLRLTAEVFSLASARGLLINSFDNPEHSNFGMVALVAAGHLRLAISTSNASPSLAGRLRRDLESIFDEEFVEYVGLLARVRERLRDEEPDRERRWQMLRSLVADFSLQGRLEYPEKWRETVEKLLAD
jgi:precorrin-2 dehydrogenase/sirohydrochlorin ferrochelatase